MALPNWLPTDLLNNTDIAAFKSSLRGELIVPGEPAYEDARKVYNAAIERYPRLIARCVDVADVITAVNFGRERGLAIAIRGGGHNAGGLGVCDDGLVIDLSRMKGVHVDPAKKTVRVESGCTLGDVDHATHAFGLAVPGGILGTTGIAGLTLGGGIGHLSRRYGLSIDNLLSVDMVLADGSFVTASATHNSDLFWAVRGGGGNFGVVTSFLFRGQPVKNVFAGPTLWSLDQAAEVMRAYRDFIVKAPRDINGFFLFLTVPPAPPFPAELHHQKMCGIFWCCTAPPANAEKALKPMRSVGRSSFDHVGSVPFPMVQGMFDPLYPPGLHWYWRADFVKELSDEAIEQHVKHGSELPTPLSSMHMYPIDATAHKPKNADTAFSYRDANWAEVIVGVSPDPADKDKYTQWTKDYFDATHPYSAGGAYVNFMMEEGQERVKASYRDNYARLAAIKKEYDPANLFHVNQNIKPAQ